MMPDRLAAELADEGLSTTHVKCLDFVRRRLHQSEMYWSQRHPRWRECERILRAFRIPDAQDQQTKIDSRTEGVEKIVVPYGYAVLHAALAFCHQTITGRKPLIPVEGVGPADVLPSKLNEAILAGQADRMDVPLSLFWYQILLDAFRYGVGIGKCLYGIDEFPSVERRVSPILDPFTQQPIGYQDQLNTRDTIRYEGNKLLNIAPFDFFPDSRVSLGEFQRGEYCAHHFVRSWTEARQREAQGLYAGVEHIPKTRTEGEYGGSPFGFGGDAESDLARTIDMSPQDRSGLDEHGKPFIDFYEMWAYVDDPDKLELGDIQPGGSTPRMWVFTVANMERIVRIEPAMLPAMRFPFEVFEPHFDVHSPANFSLIEQFKGLQYYYSWLFNCFDKDTEILTQRGFVALPNLSDLDDVATVDPDTRAVWFEQPAKRYVYPYDGELVRVEGRTVDLLVTPNHEIFAARRRSSGYDGYEWIAAEKLDGEYRLPIGGLKIGWDRSVGEMIFGEEPPVRYRGRPPKYPEKRIPLTTWAAFLGYFVAEGSITLGSASGTYTCTLAQKKPETVDLIDTVMGDMPWTVTRYVDEEGTVRWTIADRRLYRWLLEHVGAGSENKSVPECVWGWSSDLQRVFLRCAIAGDGHVEGEYACYSSTSVALADGIQRCALAVGYSAHLSQLADPLPSGKTYWKVHIHFTKTDHSIQTSRNVHRESYRGNVYCVENSTHLVVVRRNGKVCITGQSRMTAVRRTLNNELVYDPDMVEERDILDPEPGRLIRIKREYRGEGRANQSVFPIPVQDTTQGHLESANFVKSLIQEIMGVPPNLMGIGNTGRRSATETQAVMKSATGRLGLLLEIWKKQFGEPLADQMVRNNQAFLDLSQPLALREPYKSALGMPFIQLTPNMLKGEFTYPFLDGGLPTDKAAEAAILKEFIMAGMQANPQMLAMMPWKAIIARWLWAIGFKDLQTFQLSMGDLAVMAPEQVDQQLQQGNLVPAQGPPGAQVRTSQNGEGGGFPIPPYETVPGVGPNGMGRA